MDFVEFDEHGVPVERTHPKTEFYVDASESVLVHNDSPDVGADWGLNPYRGCEHGCAYCFARPYHDYLGFNSGIDFETRIMVKTRAPQLLRQELAAKKWKPAGIMLSGATDCYQPAERHFRLTRGCLEVLAEFRNPVHLITKNFMITRDIDVISELARHNCVSVTLSITSLDSDLSGRLEPRASRPEHRLRAVRMLSDAGIPVNVNIAPVIPGLNDHEIPAILDSAAAAGAQTAMYILLRLPHALKDVFSQWLDDHEPLKKDRVLTRIRDLRGGKLYNSEWGKRLTGEGIWAEQMKQLFEVSARRAGLNLAPRKALTTANFRRPGGVQMELL